MTQAAISKRRRVRTCFICEQAPGTTKEHVIPENLFPAGLRENLWTARSCRPCNDRLAPDEELFRVFVTGQAEQGSVGFEVWREGVRRTLAKQPKLKAMLASQMKLMEVRSPAGLHLGKRWAIPTRADRINPVLEKIVRGLYLRENRSMLGGTEWDVHFNPSYVAPEILNSAKRGELNTPVFRYAFVQAQDDPRASIWWLGFYEKALFVVTTWPPERNEEYPELAI